MAHERNMGIILESFMNAFKQLDDEEQKILDMNAQLTALGNVVLAQDDHIMNFKDPNIEANAKDSSSLPGSVVRRRKYSYPTMISTDNLLAQDNETNLKVNHVP